MTEVTSHEKPSTAHGRAVQPAIRPVKCRTACVPQHAFSEVPWSVSFRRSRARGRRHVSMVLLCLDPGPDYYDAPSCLWARLRAWRRAPMGACAAVATATRPPF